VDATHKVMEWFIPWRTYGTTGYPMCSYMDGKLLGLAAGYDDRDGDNVYPDKLRWPSAKDPWLDDQNYWGSMRLPDGIGGGCGVIPRSGGTVATALHDRGSSPSMWYSLRGQRLSPAELGAGRATGIMVQQGHAGQPGTVVLRRQPR